MTGLQRVMYLLLMYTSISIYLSVWPIVSHFEFNEDDIGAYPYLKPHILFYSNGFTLAIWHSSPDNSILKIIKLFWAG